MKSRAHGFVIAALCTGLMQAAEKNSGNGTEKRYQGRYSVYNGKNNGLSKREAYFKLSIQEKYDGLTHKQALVLF